VVLGTDTVYDIVPGAKTGLSVPPETVRALREESSEGGARKAVMVVVFVVVPSGAIATIVTMFPPGYSGIGTDVAGSPLIVTVPEGSASVAPTVIMCVANATEAV
jgi:hypothetical protein